MGQGVKKISYFREREKERELRERDRENIQYTSPSRLGDTCLQETLRRLRQGSDFEFVASLNYIDIQSTQSQSLDYLKSKTFTGF